jgi:adenylyl- and sulfurtransferase ThiI
MKNEMILCKYGEIALKGLNRATFENRLVTQLRRKLRPFGNFEVSRAQSTVYVRPLDDAADMDSAVEAVKCVFGIVAVGRALTVEKDLDAICAAAKDYLCENLLYEHWNFNKDGASQICRLLFEEATDINFYVGKAVNPAHQNPDLPINFNIKMNLVEELSVCLKQMGKRIKVSYF